MRGSKLTGDCLYLATLYLRAKPQAAAVKYIVYTLGDYQRESLE